MKYQSAIGRGAMDGMESMERELARRVSPVLRTHRLQSRRSRYRMKPSGVWRFVAALGLLCGCLAGCPATTPTDIGDIPFLDQANNFDFSRATALSIGEKSEFTFRGTINSSSDVDVYDLGAFAAGDRLFVDVRRKSGNLDAVAAVFDRAEQLISYNDDRKPDATDLNPLIDFVAAAGSETYYLGIAPLYGSNSTGDYEVTVRITRGEGAQAASGQVVFLDWRGGNNIIVENVGVYNLPPFNAADLGPYEGQTTYIQDRVKQIVEDRFRGFRLTVLSSHRDSEPSGSFTSIYFGGDSRRAFAISQQIDSWNKDPNDDCIVYTRAFSDAFARTPTVDQMAQALGNTVSHEIGHLLGLVHTASCDELMDTTCGNSRILAEQKFGVAPLDISTFPIGYQNAPQLLGWILGMSTGI